MANPINNPVNNPEPMPDDLPLGPPAMVRQDAVVRPRANNPGPADILGVAGNPDHNPGGGGRRTKRKSSKKLKKKSSRKLKRKSSKKSNKKPKRY
jgi:hypothetical protein